MSIKRRRRKKGRAHVTTLANESQRVDVTWRGKRYRKVFINAEAMGHTINAAIARDEDISQFFLVTKSVTKSDTDMFSEFIQFKKRLGLKETTLKGYTKVLTVLEQCPHPLNKPKQVRNWLIVGKPPEMARLSFRLIGACCNWAGLENPYSDYCKLIPKSEPEPRAIEGWEPAIAAYEGKYGDLFRFLFLTGCRPSEALGLRAWDVGQESLTFRGQWIGGKWVPDLKTQQCREFPLYVPLFDLATKLVTKQGLEGSDRLFPFDIQQPRRVFKKLFPGCDFYNTRDTFITEQIIKGISPDVVAQWCGNSAATIRKHYLDKIKLVKDQLPR